MTRNHRRRRIQSRLADSPYIRTDRPRHGLARDVHRRGELLKLARGQDLAQRRHPDGNRENGDDRRGGLGGIGLAGRRHRRGLLSRQRSRRRVDGADEWAGCGKGAGARQDPGHVLIGGDGGCLRDHERCGHCAQRHRWRRRPAASGGRRKLGIQLGHLRRRENAALVHRQVTDLAVERSWKIEAGGADAERLVRRIGVAKKAVPIAC